MSAGSTTASLTADTYGWDTVFALPIASVNAAIADAKASPATFEGTGTDSISGQSFTVSGTFSDWAITTGGSGILLKMAIPIPTLTLTAAKTYQFSNGQAAIQIQLQYLPQPAAERAANGAPYDLVVMTTPPSDSEPVVVILSLTFPGDPSFTAFESLVLPVLDTWFNDHLADFTYVFNTVNLGIIADQGAFAWLLPTDTSYCYADRPGQGDGIFAVLAMTGGRSATGLAQQLAPSAIPSGAQAAFLISQERFLADVLLPALPDAFPGTSVSDYQVPAGSANIILNAPAKLNDVEYNGSSYSPMLQSLTITVFAETLEIEAVTQTEVSWQIWSNCHSVYDYGIQLVPQSNGNQTLDFIQAGTPVTENWTTKGEGVEITEIIAGIVAAVAVIVIGVLTGGSGFAIAGLIIGILVGIANEIPNMIATVGTDDAPPVTLLVLNATDPIQWTGYKTFGLSSAGLNLSLQLGGTFDPA